MFKKTVVLFLLTALISLFTQPLSREVSANTGNKTLGDFLKTTEKISASYAYPSIRLASNGAGKSVLPAHSPIIMRCDETISASNIHSGSSVNFSVVNDVKDEKGMILIKAGTPVSAQVVFAEDKGMIGRSGRITISDFHTTAVDGTYIPLSGSVSAQPDDKMVLSVVLSVVVCILFLLMRGQDANIAAGTTKTAYTIVKTYIEATAT